MFGFYFHLCSNLIHRIDILFLYALIINIQLGCVHLICLIDSQSLTPTWRDSLELIPISLKKPASGQAFLLSQTNQFRQLHPLRGGLIACENEVTFKWRSPYEMVSVCACCACNWTRSHGRMQEGARASCPCGKNSCAAITARRDVVHWVGGLRSYLQERPSGQEIGEEHHENTDTAVKWSLAPHTS